MKKTIGAAVLILVLAAAGSAFAYGGSRGRGMAGQGMMGDNGVCGGSGMMRGMGGRGMMHGGGMMRACTGIPGTSVEIPQEIRDKQVEMQKLSVDMRAEMQKKPVDRAKVEELYKKRVELRNELGGWMMKQRLDMVEKLQK